MPITTLKFIRFMTPAGATLSRDQSTVIMIIPVVPLIIGFMVLDNMCSKTEELTKCYEPLQKLRVRIWPCKTGLSPPVTLCYWSFQGDTSVVVLFVLCLGV